MQAIQRTFTLVQPRVMRAAVQQPALFNFNTMKDKQVGEEKSYFSKQDSKLLKALVEKMEKRDAAKSESASEHSAMQEDLSAIFETHGLDKAGNDSLLW